MLCKICFFLEACASLFQNFPLSTLTLVVLLHQHSQKNFVKSKALSIKVATHGSVVNNLVVLAQVTKEIIPGKHFGGIKA